MKRLLASGLILLSVSGLSWAQEPRSAAPTTTAPEIPFDSIPDFLRLPEGMHFGEVPGVAVNSKGHLFVFTRSNSAYGPAYGATAAQLLEFGPTGEFIREVGKQLYAWSFAHSVRIDRDDNIWAIDKGSDMVIKFNAAGRVQWVFGRRQESADAAKPWPHVDPPLPARDGLFRQPTDVAWDSQGNIYITDGYINSRVAKYDRNGDWVKQWGTRGVGPGQFNTPHSIVIDRMDRVYVGDRGNRRVQVFDTDGKFLRQWTVDVAPDFNTRAVNGPTPQPGSSDGVGAPNSLCIPPNQNEVMFLGESTWPGRVFKVTLDGKVLGVIGKSGRNLKQFSGAHALACPSENEIYVAESSNWRVQKILLHPLKSENHVADAAFESFFRARTPAEAASASDAIVASGVSFDEAFDTLRRGRTYVRDVERGIVQRSYRGADGREYFYTLDVPERYDPAQKYQVRVQLHGGVGRIESSAPARGPANARLAGAEQIYVMPSAWKDAPWWSGRQIDNLRAILDAVKRMYNVDENRVVLSGVSDGGTGAYYAAMRDTTPFASVLPLNGFIMVLANETADSDGDLFPNNLRNKPLFIVNGGRDPLYPTRIVDPYVEQMRRGGVDVTYRPQPSAAHETSWWPDVKDSFERFVADHPRVPLPDALTWESGAPNMPSRAHWLIIDRLAGVRPGEPSLPDVNVMPAHAEPDFGIRASGTRINRVIAGSNAEAIGVRAGDVVVAINGQPAGDGDDVAETLRGYPSGRPLLLTVSRGGGSVRLTGRYAPTLSAAATGAMLPRSRPSGRVDLVRTGNRVEAKSRGVRAFTLLLSPDQFDLTRPIEVVVNGRPMFNGTVTRDIRTLLTWAARDNDRTMLFAAKITIEAAKASGL